MYINSSRKYTSRNEIAYTSVQTFGGWYQIDLKNSSVYLFLPLLTPATNVIFLLTN